MDKADSSDSGGLPRTLEALLVGYQKADAQAIAELVCVVNPLLYRYFRAHPGMREEAPDLLQEAWLRIHKARATYQPDKPARPWLYAIAKHTLLDAVRRKARVMLRETSLDYELVSKVHVSPESLLEVARLLNTLPESQREVIQLLKVDGLTLEEVAAKTSSSVGAVKQRAHRAYRKLRGLFFIGQASAREQKKPSEL